VFFLSGSGPGVFVPYSLYLAISSNPLYNKFYIVLLHSVKLVMSKVAVPYNSMGEMAMEHIIKGKMVSAFAFRSDDILQI
jgi:hypothetical protein